MAILTPFPALFNRKNLVAGLATLVPVSVSLWAIHLLFSSLTGMINRVAPWDNVQTGSVFLDVLIDIGLIVTLFVGIVLLGLMVNWRLHLLIRQLETHVVEKVPLLNKVYRFTKDTVHQFLGGEHMPLEQVAAFRDGTAIKIGFVTDIQTRMANVLVFSAPAPSNGFNHGVLLTDLHRLNCPADVALSSVIKFGIGLGPLYEQFLDLEARGESYARCTQS